MRLVRSGAEGETVSVTVFHFVGLVDIEHRRDEVDAGGACDPLLSPTVPLMCWVFNCASARATIQTLARTTTITIRKETRFVTTAVLSGCPTQHTAIRFARQNRAHARRSEPHASAPPSPGPLREQVPCRRCLAFLFFTPAGGYRSTLTACCQSPAISGERPAQDPRLIRYTAWRGIRHRKRNARRHRPARSRAEKGTHSVATWRTTCSR